MDRRWFEEQVKDLEAVLSDQKIRISPPQVEPLTYPVPVGASIANLIDHTLLIPEAGPEEINDLVAAAKHYGFAAVCVNPCYVKPAALQLGGSPVKVCTVIGFPLGAATTRIKVAEAQDALANGAEELDMVIALGKLKNKDYGSVYEEISLVKQAAGKCIVKVIIETALLNPEEIVRASLLAKAAQADFVKTSTGFGPGGASVEAVALVRQTVGSGCGVKAAGGIKDYQTAKAMIVAGANRLGTSSGVNIVKMSVGETDAG